MPQSSVKLEAIMKAIRVESAAPVPVLNQVEVSIPEAASGHLLVEVRAAAVTPTELLWYPTSHTQSGDDRHFAIPGHEFSGVVAGLPPETTEYALGDEIFGMNDWFAEGAMAEYCLAPLSSVARKPSRLSHPQAASVPISALTAWQGLHDRAQLQKGQRVLIHGAAGAVGVYAVQLAHLAGAVVLTTSSATDFDFLQALGADQCIDYRAAPFEQVAHDIDVVFDAVGGETLQRSWQVLRTGGRLVTIAADSEGVKDQRSREAFFIVEANRFQLANLAAMLDASELHCFVDQVLPFSGASDAYLGRIQKRGTGGKIVIEVASS